MLALADYISRELQRIGIVPVPVADNPHETIEQVRANMGTRYKVWSGASDRTIWPTAQANWNFRALHDWQHVLTGSDFTLHGERDASEFLVKTLPPALRRRYGAILRAEVYGQAMVALRDGTFAADQVAFTLSFLSGEIKQ